MLTFYYAVCTEHNVNYCLYVLLQLLLIIRIIMKINVCCFKVSTNGVLEKLINFSSLRESKLIKILICFARKWTISIATIFQLKCYCKETKLVCCLRMKRVDKRKILAIPKINVSPRISPGRIDSLGYTCQRARAIISARLLIACCAIYCCHQSEALADTAFTLTVFSGEIPRAITDCAVVPA